MLLLCCSRYFAAGLLQQHKMTMADGNRVKAAELLPCTDLAGTQLSNIYTSETLPLPQEALPHTHHTMMQVPC